ncbi:acetyl-CoA C-acetyltransferase [Saccharospirillum mangrovi]|uniref:acetyl-CoA C-acetyltransferase n=1 Tax=Saccharospirillum mangrovi TaxID=2161747 RepID=UPI000D38B0F1|nr:acetyl-CoA C-acetyltransferase [Saccharospirillum mangrovi]
MKAVIIAAARTPIGRFNGALASLSAVQMGSQLLAAMLARQPQLTDAIDEVILGQVLTAGCGQNPARQTALNAGLSDSVTALTINKVCGSGLKAVQLAAQSVLNGDARVAIAGGQESMSQAAHLLPGSRSGKKFGDWKLIDSMIVDGLWDAFNDYHMGQTAENIAQRWDISREQQDAFAVRSQQRAHAAQQAGRFNDEILPLSIAHPKAPEQLIDQDEQPRPDTNAASLASLRPAFRSDGSVTAGNASALNDGAALVAITTDAYARQMGLPILGVIDACSSAGVDPALMGTGPIAATQKVLEKAGWSLSDIDLIEANEAFAAQALCVSQELGLPDDRLNVNGGAIALGHPIGASGCRILVTLLHELQRQQLSRGLATLCIGGGMGISMLVSRPDI